MARSRITALHNNLIVTSAHRDYREINWEKREKISYKK
jgi:hypothetical protein